MFASIAMLGGGLLLLYKGAGWLITGSSSLAQRLGVKPVVIGLTVVAFGTSAPELFINLMASFSGAPDIAISNIIGSNIANILLILGIVAIIRPLSLRAETISRQIPLALLAAGLVWVLASDRLLVGRVANRLDRIDGIILLAFALAFIYYVVTIAKRESSQDGVERKTIGVSLLLIGLGLLCLSFGGKLTVESAVDLARRLSLSERVIGLTVVALGTSLPELLTSVVAVIKRHDDLAIGNIVGSNILNVFWILGLSAVVRPLPVSTNSLFDMLVVVEATALLLLFSLVNAGQAPSAWRRFFLTSHRTSPDVFAMRRWQGLTMVSLYVAYLAVLIFIG